MSYITSIKITKANFISLFLLAVMAGMVMLSFTVLSAQKSKNLTKILVTPVAQINSLNKNAYQKVDTVLPKVIPEKLEARLKITKIGVDAAIKDMGVTSGGIMDVPNNLIDVGWFSFGTRPGEIGSAVIGAHNRFSSKPGVFANLDQLVKGDVLSVVDARGVSTSFVVMDIRTYDATDANTGIFESKNGVHLNLITCSGDWNPSTKTYTKRLVIFTDVIRS